MRVIGILIAALAGAALAAAPIWGEGAARLAIPPGTDAIPQSSARIEIQFEGAAPETLALTGPTLVQRGAQVGDTIPTELVSMSLSGVSQTFRGARITIQTGAANGTTRVPGEVDDVLLDRSGNFISGNSRFTISQKNISVFQERDEFHFRYDVRPPLVMAARIYTLPPNVPVTTLRKLGKVDHFKCYSVKARTKFTQRKVALRDQFESEQATVRRPVRLCTPVRKNSARLLVPAAHLKCYEISSTSEQPKKDEVEVEVTNQFGQQQLIVLKPRTLCLPSLKKKIAKIVPKPKPPPGSLGKLTDHFKCYDVRAKSSLPQRVVSLDDQFEIERARVLQPVSLCAPVEKNRQLIADSTTHLTCYQIKDLSRRKKAGSRIVVVRNQFGTEVLTVVNPQVLCVPSTKEPPCSEYAERVKAQLVQGNQVVATINAATHTPFGGVKDSPCE